MGKIYIFDVDLTIIKYMGDLSNCYTEIQRTKFCFNFLTEKYMLF